MNPGTWLTIIGLFIAFIAFFPREEFKVIQLKIYRIEIYILLTTLFFLIPFLIFFDGISSRISFFQFFTVQGGIASHTIAFIVTYITILWTVVRILWHPPKKIVNQCLIDYYSQLLNEVSFEKFTSVFLKYESNNLIIKNWQLYKSIILNPIFIEGIFKLRQHYFLNFWNKLSTKEEFQSILKTLINYKNSIYYTELTQNRNSYSLLPDKPLLNILILVNIQQSMDFGVIKFISSIGNHHLQSHSNYGGASIYNQKYATYFHDDGGFHLELLYHINFIGVLYFTNINMNRDIGSMSNYRNMQSIFSQWINNIINNISLPDEKTYSEYPTNYHWLISQMITESSRWLDLFNEDEHYNEDFSYNTFIPMCIGLSFEELFKGHDKKKITIDFIKSKAILIISYFYFAYESKKLLLEKLEEYFILKIPKELIEDILGACLDHRFVLDYSSFKSKDYRFPVIHGWEKERLENLRAVLLEKNLI